ncbi:MAG: hypothetical protein ABIV51_02830 [Saprospiraceae bacterium]
MKLKQRLLVVCVFCILWASCNDDESCKAGAGGDVTLVAFPQHHTKPVRPDSVYVKFDSKEFPGASPLDYDLAIAADTTEDHVFIENLKCGDYYIYMIGYDHSIIELVRGGIPYTIADNLSGEIDLDIPVTE